MKNTDRANGIEKLIMQEYHRPVRCKECNGVMVYRGVGEYQCEECKAVEYDDYGKVRNFVEKNPGATILQVESSTGVSRKSIQQMLREERLEVSADSKSFLKCEVCGVSIRYGRFCQNCQVSLNRRIEEEERRKRNNIQGFATAIAQGEKGAKRFIREK